MTIAKTHSLATATRRRASCSVCRLWLVLALIILLALQWILATGIWEYPHARLLMPDVIRTENGFATPPMVTVRDHYIIRFEAPPRPSGEPIKE